MTKKEEKIKQNIIQIGNNLEIELSKEEKQIDNIIYYNDLEFGESGLGAQNIYVVQISETEEIQNDNVQNEGNYIKTTMLIYNEEQELIATVDNEGIIHFTEQYLEELKNFGGAYFETLELENIEFQLPEDLKEKDIVMTKEEIKEYAEKEKTAQDKETKEQETEKEKKERTAQTLGVKEEEIRSISTINPREKITDRYNLIDIMPEAGKYKEISIVCTKGNTNNSGTFTVLGINKDGTREQLNSIEPIEGTSGSKDVISVNEDGTEVKEKQVKGLMRINARNRADGISVSLGDYGMLDIDYISNVMDKKNRRATPIRTKEIQNQRISTAKVRENAGDSIEEMEKEGEIFRKQEEKGINPQSLDGIETDKYYAKTLEDLKKEIKEKALEDEEMSSSELSEFIRTEINKSDLELTNEEVEQTAKEIQIEVVDELRGNRQRI